MNKHSSFQIINSFCRVLSRINDKFALFLYLNLSTKDQRRSTVIELCILPPEEFPFHVERLRRFILTTCQCEISFNTLVLRFFVCSFGLRIVRGLRQRRVG